MMQSRMVYILYVALRNRAKSEYEFDEEAIITAEAQR